MTAKSKPKMERLNSRVFPHQAEYVRGEVKKSKGDLTEGDVYRALIDEAITSRKNK